MRVRVATDADRDRFNSFVGGSPFGDVLQSYEWGDVKRRSGWSALRLLVEDGEYVRAACSVLRTKPARGIPPLLYAPRGPVLDPENTAALSALVDAIRERAGDGFMLKCDPPVEAGSTEAAMLAGTGFRLVTATGFGGVQPKAVMVLDLDNDLDKIFGGFKSKWRYNVRLAERKGVVVREAARDDLPAFYKLLVETARRDHFFVRGRSYFETLWDVLQPRGMLAAFLAELAGRPIAGILLFAMGERATYTYGASSNEHRNVMPNHLLQWHGIRWAKERGCRVYDFRGVSPVLDGRPVEPSIAGLNRFKEGFGARYVEYAGEFDLPLRAGWYRLWRTAAPAAMTLRRRIKGGGGAAQAD
jgi:lipid II:glycine glycyltransferase (peptidoglycan interpeptide bridge formation enzyme)